MMKLLGLGAITAAAAMAVSGSAFAGVLPPTTVPEPATLALMATGVGALLVVKFRKRK